MMKDSVRLRRIGSRRQFALDIPQGQVFEDLFHELFIPYDDGVFYGSSKVNEIQVASEIQLYLDLQGFRGRGEEAAEVLYERIVEKAW